MTSLRWVACDNCETLLTCGFLKSQSKPLLAGILIPLLQESPSIVITSIKAELDDIREGPSKADFFSCN